MKIDNIDVLDSVEQDNKGKFCPYCGNCDLTKYLIKKELAYHGDVLNTAARIQGKCNDFKKRVLVSETVKAILENQHLFHFSGIGDVSLRGKAGQVSLYGVETA